jgi:lysophospholipase L1-like esterase
MTRNMGYILLAALAAIVALVSGTISGGFGGFGGFGESSQSSESSESSDTSGGSDNMPKNQGSVARGFSGNWVGSWATAATATEPDVPDGHPDKSIRNVVHTSVGGTAARIQLSNRFGTEPLTITHATLALAAAPSTPTATSGTMRRLTFGRQKSVTIPPGREVTSDPVRLQVPDAADLLVTTYSPEASGPVTYHPFARQTSYLARGDRAGETDGAAYTEQSPCWRYLIAVDVWSQETDGAVVVIGDSVTDGITSSPGTNRRWTDFLARRLRTERGAPRYSVLNQGISGNRVLTDGSRRSPDNGPSGLSRLEGDVLSRTGVKTVVIQLGINDITKPPQQTDPGALVAGLEQLAQRAQDRGLRVVAATLTPFGGYPKHSSQRETVRQRVNDRIRGSAAFDSVVDFDAALRDPARPDRLRTAYDSGDHLHPSDNGYRALAEAVNLRRLENPTRPEPKTRTGLHRPPSHG